MPRSSPPRRVAAPRPVAPKPLPHVTWKRVKRLLVEGAMMTLSVLIALGINTWWEGRKDRQRVRQALTAVLYEVRANRATLDSSRAFHDTLFASWDRTLAAQPAAPLDLDRLPRPPELSDEAYQTAQSTGVLALMNYRTAAEVGRTYRLQALSVSLTDRMMERLAEDGTLAFARDEGGRMEGMHRRVYALYGQTDTLIAHRLDRLGGPSDPDD